MYRNKIAAAGLTVLMIFSGGLVACDPEDEADIREGVNQVEKAGKEAAEDAEEAVDEEVDTDGKDD
jgi:hypothetical protein